MCKCARGFALELKLVKSDGGSRLGCKGLAVTGAVCVFSWGWHAANPLQRSHGPDTDIRFPSACAASYVYICSRKGAVLLCIVHRLQCFKLGHLHIAAMNC